MTSPVVPTSSLRARLEAGERAICTMVGELRQPSVMQLLANAGYDAVIVDGEHGAFATETIADLCRAASMVGVTPIVRVPGLAYEPIAQALDGGAQAVMVPRIESAADAAQAVSFAKYPPVGERGCAFGRGQTRFRSGPIAETMAAANRESLVVIQIETREALAQIDQIVALGGVDIAFVGPTDLSIALGIPGQLDDPALVGAIERVASACRNAGIWSALYMSDLELARRYASSIDLICHSSEAALLTSAGMAAVETIRKAAHA